MATLDAGIINVALPQVASSLDVNLPLVQWVVSAYLLTISCLLPLFGRLGDMFSRRLVCNAGFFVFTLGSVLCGLSGHIAPLIAARVVQAVGAAMLMANAPAIVSAAFPGPSRGRALGMVGMVVALGSMTGPSVGGLLVGAFGWESIFYVNLPIGIAGLLAGYYILPGNERRRGEKFDYAGAGLFAVGMTAFLLAVSHGEEWGWRSALVITLAVISILALSAFVRHEKREPFPMIDLSLFKNWAFFSGNITGLLSFMAVFSNTMLLPFYLSKILNFESSHIGLLMTPFPIALAVVAPVSGYLSERVNPASLSAAGLTVTAAGLVWMAMLDTTPAIWEVVLGQSLLGLGNGLFQSPNNNSVMSAAPPAKLGIAGGINSLVRNIGQVCGIAIAVSILESRQAAALAGISLPTPGQQVDAFLSGYHFALSVGAFFAAIGAVVSFRRRGHLKPAASK